MKTRKKPRIPLTPEDEVLNLIRGPAVDAAKIRALSLQVCSPNLRASLLQWVHKQLSTPDIDPTIASPLLELCGEEDSMKAALWAIVRQTAPTSGLELLSRVFWEPTLAVRSIKIPVFARDPEENDDIYGSLHFALDHQDSFMREAVLDVFRAAAEKDLGGRSAEFLERAAWLASEMVVDGSVRVRIKALQCLQCIFGVLPSLRLCLTMSVAGGSRPPSVGCVMEGWESGDENVRLEVIKLLKVASFENAATLRVVLDGLCKGCGKLLREVQILLLELGKRHWTLILPKWMKRGKNLNRLPHPSSCDGIMHCQDTRLRPKSTDWSRDPEHALLLLFYTGAVACCGDLSRCLPYGTICEMQKIRLAWPSLPWPAQLVFAKEGYAIHPPSIAAVDVRCNAAFVQLVQYEGSLVDRIRRACEAVERGEDDLSSLSPQGSPEEQRVALWLREFLVVYLDWRSLEECSEVPNPQMEQRAKALLQRYFRLVKTVQFAATDVLDVFHLLAKTMCAHFDVSLRDCSLPGIIELPSAQEFDTLKEHQCMIKRYRVSPSKLVFPHSLYADVEVEVVCSLPAEALFVRFVYPCSARFLRTGTDVVLAQRNPGLLFGTHRVSISCATKIKIIVQFLLRSPEIIVAKKQIEVETS